MLTSIVVGYIVLLSGWIRFVKKIVKNKFVVPMNSVSWQTEEPSNLDNNNERTKPSTSNKTQKC